MVKLNEVFLIYFFFYIGDRIFEFEITVQADLSKLTNEVDELVLSILRSIENFIGSFLFFLQYEIHNVRLLICMRKYLIYSEKKNLIFLLK